jgi:hypothetical protein
LFIEAIDVAYLLASADSSKNRTKSEDPAYETIVLAARWFAQKCCPAKVRGIGTGRE